MDWDCCLNNEIYALPSPASRGVSAWLRVGLGYKYAVHISAAAGLWDGVGRYGGGICRASAAVVHSWCGLERCSKNRTATFSLLTKITGGTVIVSMFWTGLDSS